MDNDKNLSNKEVTVKIYSLYPKIFFQMMWGRGGGERETEREFRKLKPFKV